jgi:hypothetical protein
MSTHPFWTALRAAMSDGELTPSDISEWFQISYDSAYFWCAKLEGSRGPWPLSNQRRYWRELVALQLAIKEKVFPLHVAPRKRRRTVSEIRVKYHKRSPAAGAPQQRVALRPGVR